MGKRTSLVAGCLFLTLAAGIAVTGERIVDRDGDRSKAAKGRHPTFEAPRFSPQVVHMPTALRSSGSRMAATDKATILMALAAKQEHDQAFATLQQIVMMDLPSNERADAVRSRAHEKIARFYTGAPSKQVVHLGLALQFAATAERRADLRRRILDLGGDLFVLAFGNGPATAYPSRDPGADDSCLGAIAVVLPHTETMSITPAGDHNWRSFDLTGPGTFVRIETISDFPGTGTDDTDLILWDDCPENGGTILAFNDDTATDFTSRIDTHCLAPGTYYVEVGGFFDISTPDNFDLEIEVTASCEAPSVDSFEPDDDRANASDIGLPTPSSGLGWGRARHEIQARNIFPPGDTDHATFSLTQNSLVRMGTKAQWPTFFNGFAGSGSFDNPDTVLSLFYESRPSYGGRCNQPDLGFLPICYSDEDCPDPLDNPIPGFPPCIFPGFPGLPSLDNSPLVVNDDRSVGDLGSELLLCLPSSAANSPSLTLQRWGGDYLVEITPFSGGDIFNYELQVKNEVGCLFEREPNNTFEEATPIELGRRIAAFYDFVATNPYADADLYRFDVEELTTLRFETFAPDSYQSDTALELFVGPDDGGDFFYTADDDDGGSGFLSALTLTLLPANELLGNTIADADYFLNVTSFFYNPNYYYELDSEIITPPDVFETEPNDTEATANPVSIGDTVAGAIDVSCDVDTYRFELEQETFVTLSMPAGGDAAIQLVPCNETATVLACDDDSGGAMLPLIDGCLPAGTYCAQVRAFAAGDTFAYELELSGTAGCMATDPPAMSGDNAFTCLDFDSCP